MVCDECNKLARLLSVATIQHAEIRTQGSAALRALDPVALKAVVRQLEIAGAEIEELKTKLANHQASHQAK